MSIDQEPIDSPQEWVANHVRRYIATDGAEGHSWHGSPSLILTTVGRRSGKMRRLALIYGRDGDRYVVVASNGGSDQHPAWYLNLCKNPEAQVQVLGDRFRARARTATAEERAALWPRMVEILPDYTAYQEKTTREIPLVILERIDESA
jgi:deazaflavin-dependent oxidoreductase (nitroreductase family)